MSTNKTLKELLEKKQDYNWYPTCEEKIQTIANDILKISEIYDFTSKYSAPIEILDIGSGDGRVLEKLEAKISSKFLPEIKLLGIEKASVHTKTYKNKNITLIGSEFQETNLISKKCTIAFTNPPYDNFQNWLEKIIRELGFSLLYAIVPQRWIDDERIQEAIKTRGIKYSKVLKESHFKNAERQANTKVHIIRFSFDDVDKINPSKLTCQLTKRETKPTLGENNSDPFQLFIENELGLKKTYTLRNHYDNSIRMIDLECEINNSLIDNECKSTEVVKSKGLLAALIENYDTTIGKTIEQYQKVSQIDQEILKELNVDFTQLQKGIKEKLSSYRNVYWSVLINKLDAITNKLSSTNKTKLLDTLKANALDFNYLNAIYVISYAVDMANDLIETSLIEIFKTLTNESSVTKHYKSNTHMYHDSWKYTQPDNNTRFTLDYRFIHNYKFNFNHDGLKDSAFEFLKDIEVALSLLGYSDIHRSHSQKEILAGKSVKVFGKGHDGKKTNLLEIKFYKNGNRHIRLNQNAMLRLNVTVSRLLGWVRTKSEYEFETGMEKPMIADVWHTCEGMKLPKSTTLLLAESKKAA